jgi:hypothetical protein
VIPKAVPQHIENPHVSRELAGFLFVDPALEMARHAFAP